MLPITLFYSLDGLFTSPEEYLSTVKHTTVSPTMCSLDETSQTSPSEAEMMPPPTAIPSSLSAMDLQASAAQHMSEVLSSSLAAVKAELLEETSNQSAYSKSPEAVANVMLTSPPVVHHDESSNAMPPLMQMSNCFEQTPAEMIDMKIKHEIARRDSNSMDGSQSFLAESQQIEMMVTQGQMFNNHEMQKSQQQMAMEQFHSHQNMTAMSTTSDIMSMSCQPCPLMCPQVIQDVPEPLMRHNTSPVAVKNMILNAAAEILTTPQASIETQATLNALMAINTDAMLGTTQQAPTNSVHHHLNLYDSRVNDTTAPQTVVDQLVSLVAAPQTPMNTEPSVVVTNHEILLNSQFKELNDSLR